MHRGLLILLSVVGVVVAVSAGAVAYRAITHDWDSEPRVVQVTPSDDQAGAEPVEVVRVVDSDGWGHRGGFFPGFFFFPLLFFLAIILIFWGFSRGHWGGPRRGPWDSGESRFEEWHRRQHAGESQSPNQQASA